MHRTAMLLYPPRALASCVSAAVVRDTRGQSLNDTDRVNHFPATPLITVTHIIEGSLSLVSENGALDAQVPLPQQSVTAPKNKPLTSWSPGPVAAISVGIYPDAWAVLGFDLQDGPLPGELADAFAGFTPHTDILAGWKTFCDVLGTRWWAARQDGSAPDWGGTRRLRDWSRALLVRAALGGVGRSTRAMERRLKRWSGQTRQSLDFFSKVEDLHQRVTQEPDIPLAELASELGYADQSHMGRAVRRATGFSPAELNRRIETEEAFWCYRLLGERF